MSMTLSFSFENDFQRLHVELDSSSGAILYRIPESKDVDFVQKCDAWTAYEGDSKEWIAALGSLDIGSWGCNDGKNMNESHDVFPNSEVKWSLVIRSTCQHNDEEDVLKASGNGSDSYPVNFTDFLELLKKLLGLPVFLLEL